MGQFNWVESFKEQPTCDDILNKIRKIEKVYWMLIPVSILFILGGIVILLVAPAGDIKQHCFGVFLAVFGGIILAMTEICTCVKLSTLRVIWDSQNRLEREIRKSESMDI